MLTSREACVLRLIVQGMSNKQIARQLGIKLQTVKNHTSALYAKLDVENRTQAATKSIQSE